ncbi:sulfotransferase family 2 domain-containing protein [Albidovulum sp.]
MAVIGHNYLFIHVPKSAGQSITSRLGGVTKGVAAHAPLFAIAPELRAGRYAFGFVRNPWDRMVSVYAFICTKRIKRGESAEYQRLARAMGFERWLMEDAFFIHQDAALQVPDLPPIQRRSQMFWLEGCDFIGRVERLAADFAQIAEKIALKPTWRQRLGLCGPVPHRNRSPRADYRTYYSDRSAEFVATHFAPEIERFGYRF